MATGFVADERGEAFSSLGRLRLDGDIPGQLKVPKTLVLVLGPYRASNDLTTGSELNSDFLFLFFCFLFPE